MKSATTALAFVLVLLPAASAQSASRLTLDDAIALALQTNRVLDRAHLAEDRARDDVAMARIKRLPVFSVETQVSRLLRPVDVTFPAGAFGTFPSTGAVPAVDTAVTTPVNTNVLLNASVSQPLTGLIQAGLGIQQSEAAHALAHEESRAARFDVVRQVRHAYYAILEAMSALEAADTNGRLLTELSRVVQNRVTQQVALRADGLDVETRLARNDLTRVRLRHVIAANKEQLNQLLGRDLSTEFDVVAVAEMTALSPDARPAPEVTNRPDVRQAQVRAQQADLTVQQARVDRLPEVNFSLQTISPVNIDGAPRNITSAVIQVKWEPFDWGRRSRTIATRRLDAQRASHALRDTEDAARLEINRHVRSLEEARATLRVAALSQGAAREHARVRTTQYQAQATLFSDVLQAQATLAESTNQYQQALLSLLTARADLDHALGEDLVP